MNKNALFLHDFVRFNHLMMLTVYPKRTRIMIGTSMVAGIRQLVVFNEYADVKTALIHALAADYVIGKESITTTAARMSAEERRTLLPPNERRTLVSEYAQDEHDDGGNPDTTAQQLTNMIVAALEDPSPNAQFVFRMILSQVRNMPRRIANSALMKLFNTYPATTRIGATLYAAYLGTLLTATIHCRHAPPGMWEIFLVQLGINLAEPIVWQLVGRTIPQVFTARVETAQISSSSSYIDRTGALIAAATPLFLKGLVISRFVVPAVANTMFGQDKQKKKKVLPRKCPSMAAKTCRGATKRGMDKRLWISKKDKNGTYRWMRK